LKEPELLKLLGASPYLAELDEPALVFLIRFGKVREYAEGDEITKQGTSSDSIHFILDGEGRVERQRGTESHRVVLAQLKPGDIVGEIGVMIDLPRSATVVASKPTRTLEIDAPSFERSARAFPILNRVLARLLSERLRQTSERVEDLPR
jgi:CRP-like cAMP-binding protein